MGDLTASFDKSEFTCKCGHCDGGLMAPAFMVRLEKLRNLFGKPIRINSGYRCVVHNKAVGGVGGSMHLLGRAADLAVSSDADRYQLLRLATGLGFGGVGILKDALHVDDRDRQAAWTYYK
jgi:uncharacterized protein YcbK (DUF882 family)